MLAFALAIAGKDLRLALRGANGVCRPVLLGLLLIFVFSLSTPPGQPIQPQAAAAIFWLSAAFCQILIFSQLYALEEDNSARQCLLLAPQPAQGVWLGKAIAGFCLLAIAQAALFPAMAVFLGQTFSGPPWLGAGTLLTADAGMAAIGSLLGAAAQGRSGRESLLSVALFPLMLPILLAAVSLTSQCLGGAEADAEKWLGVGLAFDAVFCAAGLALFGFLYKEDE